MNPLPSPTRNKFQDDAVPPLEPGDRLSREEFERRYEAMPNVKKAELIEGVVHIAPPVRHHRHARPHARLVWWLVSYEMATPGVLTADNSTTRLDTSNEPQPDVLLLILPECGGQARISDDDYVEAAPELVGEVAASSASYDLYTKLEIYRRNGVKEYLVWRVLDREVDWFVLRGGQYARLDPDGEGILRSVAFPGLWLDATALLDGDLPRLAHVAQQGLATSEHAAFVEALRAPRG